MEVNDQTLTELLRLSQENNRMLHKMRRNAFVGGLVKFIFYFLILVVAPLWVYTTYLAPVVQQMMQTVQQLQNTGTQAQNQYNSFQDSLKQLESKLPVFMQPK